MADLDEHDRLGHLLWEVYAYTSLDAEAAMTQTPLTLASCGVLHAIAREPGITAAEIARRTPKTPQAINQVATRLEKLGFIERRLAEGRGVGLHATPAGARALEQGIAVELQAEDRLRDALGGDLYEDLRLRLDRARVALARARG